MVAAASQFLGIGLYSPQEAALYARVQPQLASRWVHGNATGRPAFRAQVPDPEGKTITFLDFVQMLAVRAVRETKSVPLSKIRQAVQVAHDQGIEFPFARRHTTYLCGPDLLLDIPDRGLLQASGAHARQFAIRPVLEPYMEELSYDADGLANLYVVERREEVEIVMDPARHFGEPILTHSGYTAQTLWHACRTEGSYAAAARAYGVSECEVRVAFRYYDSLRTPTAA